MIEIVTLIQAPIDRCFDLSLSIDLELEAGKHHNIRAVSGITTGTIGPGQRVRWKTRQFGISVWHESEITEFDRPKYFQDTMIDGVFRMFQHNHYFRGVDPGTTEMRDVVHFSMPVWLLGSIVERLIVRPRLMRLIEERNRLIKMHAEAGAPFSGLYE